MSTNFQLERLKLNLDIVEKPENRVHKLTDSNVSLAGWQGRSEDFGEGGALSGAERQIVPENFWHFRVILD